MGRTAARNGHKADTDARTITRVAAYVRVSTEEQAESGLGLGDQSTKCIGMAAAKGWPAPTVYADKGISGTKDVAERPALAQLMEDVRAGRVGAVIVSELSRLGRKTRLVLHLVEQLGDGGVQLVSCKESLDTTTATGQFVLTMFAALAELERKQIAERTRGAMAHLSSTTGYAGGRIPYGYVRAADGALEIDQKTAEGVRRIFQLHRRQCSLRDIAERLQAEGRPAPRGERWHHTAVATIIANRDKYRGGKRGTSSQTWPRILAAA